LAVDPFEVAHQQHAKVHARRNAAAAAALPRLVVPAAAAFDPGIEAGRQQQGVELHIERMPLAPRQLVRRDEQRLLPILPHAHRHP
jgi:hypothetical protein